MSTFIHRLALASWAARKRVIGAWLAVLVVLGGLVALSGARFDNEFRIPGAASQEALDQLRMTFPEAAMSSATVVVLAPEGQRITDPDVRAELEAAASDIEQVAWVDTVQLPYSEYVEGLLSEDGTAGLITVRATPGITGSTITDADREELVAAADALAAAVPGSEVHVGGDLFSASLPHLSVVEVIGVAVAILVLFLTLGSFVAALMPLASALVGAGLSTLLIMAASHVFTINSTTLMLALMLALAVGIDYSLLIVSRHRDQLATGMDARESAARATATAGSAVLFAGVTVIIALIGLGIAGIPFLTTMGIFAALAVALEVALAVTLLPAMLGFAGERLRPAAPRARRGWLARLPRFNASAWWVGVVTKVPALTIAVVVLGLGALTLPAQHLHLALPNSGRNDPAAADRVTFDVIAERFGVGFNGPLVVTGSIVESDDPMGVIGTIRDDIEALPGVELVAAAVPNPNVDTMMIQVIPTTGPDDPATTELVQQLRALAPQWEADLGVATAVTGYTAVAIDVSDQLGAALLPFGVFVMGLSLILLTLVFRSVWVPVKAALGYLLSVGAAFGITTLVFNDGVGRQLINLAEPQPIISFLPIILMGILFGLAMDYEVFLTMRMREEYVHGNHTDAVEQGFVHSAKVVVAAALIMVSVFAFFIPEGDVTLKPIAFGLALGVAIDAFVVRMTLGPAVMKLLGNHAWWLPRLLDRRLPVLDAEGEGITHALALADWPEGSTAVIHGEGLGAATPRATLFDGVDLDVQPGHSLVLTGEPRARRALLLALAGRLTLTSGDLKVLGHVLPQQAGALRRDATFVDGADDDAARALTDPVGELVVIDDADRLSSPAREALAALLARSGDDGDPAPTLVLGAADADGVRALLPTRVRSTADAVTLGGAA
ncbi:MMPL family transporter [Propioniciclava soli]|uniref:MMPL family transporter n=1 Tax=Propioniciclava soli TaxID=2775081 RepID=A0ABZ3C6D8_9ACTN